MTVLKNAGDVNTDFEAAIEAAAEEIPKEQVEDVEEEGEATIEDE